MFIGVWGMGMEKGRDLGLGTSRIEPSKDWDKSWRENSALELPGRLSLLGLALARYYLGRYRNQFCGTT